MERKVLPGGKGILALVVAGAAIWALVRRPPKTIPSAAATTPSSSVVPSASNPPAEHPEYGELGTEPIGAAPSIDPESVAETPPPDPPTTCPESQVLATLPMHDHGVGVGCVVPDSKGMAAKQKEGLWVIRLPDGRIKAGKYEGGREEGIWLTWWANGRRATIVAMVHGFPDGRQIDWAETGQRYSERTYKDGTLDGLLIITFPDGVVRREVWKAGHRISPPPDPPPSP